MISEYEKHITNLREMWEDNAGSLTPAMVADYMQEQGMLDNKSLEQQLLNEYYNNYETTKPDESEIQNLKSLIAFVLNKIYRVQSAKDNHLTNKEFETLSVRITPSFYDIDLDGATNSKGDVLRKLRIIINDIIDNRIKKVTVVLRKK